MVSFLKIGKYSLQETKSTIALMVKAIKAGVLLKFICPLFVPSIEFQQGPHVFFTVPGHTLSTLNSDFWTINNQREEGQDQDVQVEETAIQMKKWHLFT